MSEPLLGLVTGCLFGFLMQKAGVLRFDRQVGALMFRDMTIIKFMLSAILVGSVGLQLLAEAGQITMSPRTLNTGVIVGGLLFGAGWAVAGFCPGTAVGAVAEGRWHALFVIAGMFAGAALYAEAEPWLKTSVQAWRDFGPLTLSQVTHLSPWYCIALLWGVGTVTFVWCAYKKV
ncbi:MAG TPA: YeeE/YedE thiosulfate transporter family protein [Kiritimatiellia bacterium]|jgi:hypothetical protein|nr:YeeE/YedE thiosulfate transporter family protein [Kiritimatiellia bacterium]HOM58658.1 YeeE/YedE thiosulfate transporter family protein [Kiritimatiellia bacterium]HOR98783.1 YeeE/YedE thiosulfate transporter family protein [Kiritimatiellia bacterium]HPC48926.1 YeeE/YedE thiosulfate transporter family protein [Kiritimatiellia bacterium]HRU18840.1 YeeE/YedE thiosulfate transporter family protein [Kiritimatiellia bacterium]